MPQLQPIVMPQLPSLMDELIEEILLRLSPDDPRSLLSAALVCKAWCRLVCSPSFNKRFREFHHRTPPPLLGFFCSICKPSDAYWSPSETPFVPLTSSLCRLPQASMPNWRAVDVCHGRVLFYDNDRVVNLESVRLQLIVWNPITGQTSTLPVVPMYTHMDRWNAALLCDHIDSGHNPFRVVVVTTDKRFIYGCVYSSEQNVWSTSISIRNPVWFFLVRGCKTLIGNALYFKCDEGLILEYNMSKQKLSLISLPSECKEMCIALMTAEDGGLGFAVVCKSMLYTWSRKVDLNGDGWWAQQRVYMLDKFIPSFDLLTCRALATRVLAVESAHSVVFIGTCTEIFAIDLKFERVRKRYERSDSCFIVGIVPYASFCTPGSCLFPMHETKCN